MANISHQEARSYLLFAGEDALAVQERLALDAHIAACAECRAYAGTLENTQRALRRSLHRRWDPARARVSIEKIQAGSRRNNMSKRMMLTGGTLAVIAILAVVVVELSSTLTPQANAASGPTGLMAVTAPVSPAAGAAKTTPVQLGKGGILPYARWSPDGRRLIIHSADDALFYVVNRDGSGLSKLSDLQAWDARWSTDGRTIRICQEQTGQPTFKVFSVSPDGSNLTELPAEEAVAAVLDGHCPSTWSPDGKTIAFAKSDGSGLYFVDANGQNVRQVVGPDLGSVNVLKWSLDSSGSSLIFSALDPAKPGAPTGIYTTQIDNAGHIANRNLLHQFTDLESFFWWLSPDGQKIIYVPQEPRGVYVANVAGAGAWSRLTDLYVSNMDVENLQWSPDGSQIAFSSLVNRDPDIFVVNTDGSGLRYYPNPGPSDQLVAWSPDGQSLVFSSQVQENQTPVSQISLHLIDVKDLTGYDAVPTATAPAPYPAPELLQPADGASFQASGDKVTLSWAPVAGLRENEIYVVSITDVTDPNNTGTTGYVTATQYVIPANLRPNDGLSHLFRWSVVTARHDPSGNQSWIPAGDPSEQRVFTWQGPAPQASATNDSARAISGAGQCQPTAADGKVTYTVQQGDTLGSIAANYGVTAQSIRDLNGLGADAAIQVGQSLWIALPAQKKTPTALPPFDYTVQPGDTASSIALTFNISVQSLIVLNNLSAEANLSPGQTLRIPYPTPTPAASAEFKWPLPEHFLSGQDYSLAHPGLDLAGTAGEPVWAAGAGNVVFAGPANAGLGNVVVLDHGRGLTTVYAHLAELRVSCGANATVGQVIGTVGQSGDTGKPLLYFEIRQGDIPQNPWNYLPPP